MAYVTKTIEEAKKVASAQYEVDKAAALTSGLPVPAVPLILQIGPIDIQPGLPPGTSAPEDEQLSTTSAAPGYDEVTSLSQP